MAFDRLIFEDNFEKDGLPDPSKWTFETGGGGWGNNESQYYTDRETNAFVKSGRLFLKAFREQVGDNKYTSAKLTTYGKQHFQYGKFEIRAKLCRGKGSWPAIWMLPADIKEGVKWPECGEIDIMEHVGWNENQVHVSLHTGKYNHRLGTQRTDFTRLDDVFDTFHVYGLEWTEDRLTFQYDGKEVKTWIKGGNGTDAGYQGWPFDKPYYLILNIAVGGSWGGEIDEAALPYMMEVDWVRVYGE